MPDTNVAIPDPGLEDIELFLVPVDREFSPCRLLYRAVLFKYLINNEKKLLSLASNSPLRAI